MRLFVFCEDDLSWEVVHKGFMDCGENMPQQDLGGIVCHSEYLSELVCSVLFELQP